MVAGWDVVEHLGAHQANLVPPDRPATAALLALPTPAIVRALLGDGAARLREHWIERWAERLGGGDGPLPTVDLDSDRRSLGRILRGLADGGCVRLWVIGARDQAGFARELVCRWPGELQLDVGAQAPELQP